MISTFVYFFSAIIILLALLLVIYNWNINKNVVYLTAFLVIFAFENSLFTAAFFDNLTESSQFYIFIVSFLFLKTPLLFLFVRGVAKDNFVFKWRDVLHFLPFVAIAVINFPSILVNFQNNADIQDFLSLNPGYLVDNNLSISYPDFYVDIALFAQFVIYITIAFFYIFHNKKMVKDLTGQIRFQYQYTISRMLLLLIIISLITIIRSIGLFYMVYKVDDIYSAGFINNIQIVGLILYFFIPVYIMLNPKFLFGLPYLETHHVSAGQFEATNKDVIRNENNIHQLAANEDNYFKELSGKIMDYINIEKPYLDRNFKIDDISKTFDVPHNHIYYCLNEIQQTKFNMLRNEKRVEFAKELLKTSYEEISIEDIGHQSGFSSVSSFYSTFKDVTGFTPVQWVKMNKNLKK
jgi:AraC-like DNA-binding protein